MPSHAVSCYIVSRCAALRHVMPYYLIWHDTLFIWGFGYDFTNYNFNTKHLVSETNQQQRDFHPSGKVYLVCFLKHQIQQTSMFFFWTYSWWNYCQIPRLIMPCSAILCWATLYRGVAGYVMIRYDVRTSPASLRIPLQCTRSSHQQEGTTSTFRLVLQT